MSIQPFYFTFQFILTQLPMHSNEKIVTFFSLFIIHSNVNALDDFFSLVLVLLKQNASLNTIEKSTLLFLFALCNQHL